MFVERGVMGCYGVAMIALCCGHWCLSSGLHWVQPCGTAVQGLSELPGSLGCGDSKSGPLGDVCVSMVSPLCGAVNFPVGQSRISGFVLKLWAPPFSLQHIS